MSTQGILARGSKWGWTELHDVWGSESNDEWNRVLGELVRQRFHDKAAAANIDAYWQPQTSEVIGAIHQDIPDTEDGSLLDSMRIEAFEEVFMEFINGEHDDKLPEIIDYEFIDEAIDEALGIDTGADFYWPENE